LRKRRDLNKKHLKPRLELRKRKKPDNLLKNSDSKRRSVRLKRERDLILSRHILMNETTKCARMQFTLLKLASDPLIKNTWSAIHSQTPQMNVT
jgi:hypothetical protein